MRTLTKAAQWVLGLVLAWDCSGEAKSIVFGGHTWTVRSGQGGPGPNTWSESNVWLDAQGCLHLKISRRDGGWTCAEVTTQRRLGFGRYEFHVEGRLDQFDDNVVLGLFNYPTRDVGSDATHEIDVEFARWGDARNLLGNYTVWPVDKGLKPTSSTFGFTLAGTGSTHRFEWGSSRVRYRSWNGHPLGEGSELAHWTFEPVDWPKRISQDPMPVHINLWLFQGRHPKDGQEVEVVIRSFGFTPDGVASTPDR